MKTPDIAIFSRGGGGNVIALAALALSVASTATAGVKYWDNPDFKEFDVGDYVQDGLVLNYDGIRNAGADCPHNPSATTWVNLGTGGSAYDMVKKGSPASSYWTGNGFYFDNKTWFVTPNTLNHGDSYEIESLVDAEHDSQPNIGYILFLSTVRPRNTDEGWRYGSIGIRAKNTTYTGQKSPYDGGVMCLNTDRSTMGAGTAKRPILRDETFQYLTAIANDTYTALFTGLDEPTDAPGYSGLGSGGTALESEALYFYLGGHNANNKDDTTTAECLTGTIRNFRYYSAPLSREQRAWNRVVDEARYFHRRGAIPVTNVVVAVSGIDGISDDHFALDEDGYTFTAPASRTVAGKRYALGGYTLETWDGSAWVADGEGTHTGNSVSLSDTSALVRITWQYSRPSGEGQLKHYDVGDYVTDGLLLFYDGILNQGVGNAHSYDATTWVNIGNGDGSQDFTLALNHKLASSGAPGCWGDDGFNFLGYSEFRKDSLTLAHPTTHSIQILVDASAADQLYNVAYPYATAWDYSSFCISKTSSDPKKESFFWNACGNNAPNKPYVFNSDGHYDYATAIMNGSAKTLAFTDGVDIPSSGSLADGFYQSETDFPSFNAARIFLGGYNADTRLLVGKVKFFRYYPNKALTPAEVLKNRKVDEYRYFGRYIVTNVLVQSTYKYLEGYDKCGPYEVDGSYTFVAPDEVTAPNGIKYACDGYTVEVPDGSGWKVIASGTGNAYFYETSAGTVRLTWKWKPVSGRRTKDDYSLDDLSQAGLALHYDGLLNQGLGEARSTTSSKWVNLGSAGPSMDLSTQRKSGDTSAWGDKGYEYAGYTYFQSAVNTYVWGGSYSAQILADAKYADNKHVSGNYLAASSWNRFGMQVYGDKNLARSNVQGIGNDAMRVTYPTEDGIDYMTVIADAAAKVDYAFAGTKIPTSGNASSGYRPYTTQLDPYANYFRLGGWGGGNNGQGLTGTIYTFRYYDRVLTNEELVRNRNVDSVRYFGELATTNVVYNGKAYKVEGKYTWNAPEKVVEDDVERKTAGYWLETSDGTKTWHEWEAGESHEFTYDTAERNDTVTLTWGGPRPGMLIIVR